MASKRTGSSCGPWYADPEQWTWCSQRQTLQRFVYLSCDRHITEAFLVSEMFEGGDHVGLEVVPAEAELLIIGHGKSDQVALQ